MELRNNEKLKLYTNLVRVRKLDELLAKALLTGKLTLFFHSQQGQEAIGVGACTFLRKDDYLLYSHRGHGIGMTVPKGVSPRAILCEHLTRANGCCGGISAFHTAAPDLGIPGISGTIGGAYVMAVGMGMAAQMSGQEQVVVCIQGDGSAGKGNFHESMIMAANWKLPIVWIIENNQFMTFSPTCEIHPKEDIADLAFGYGIPGVIVDGQDVVAVYEAVQAAVDRAREGLGPSLIEGKTYRVRPHSEGMPDLKGHLPRPPEEVEAWKKRDPIKLFGEKLLQAGVLTRDDVNRIDCDAANEMEEALQFALDSPMTGPELLDRALYAE